MKTLLTLLLCTSLLNNGFAVIDYGTTGFWNATSTWASGTLPESGDTLVVPFGSIITINDDAGTYADMYILVYGVLTLQGGHTLSLTANGIIDIFLGGVISGLHLNDKIVIDGSTVWTTLDLPAIGPVTCFAGGCANNPTLPIELLYFSSELFNENANLFWATKSESNNDFFTLWKATDSKAWKVLTMMDGAGNSTHDIRYQYTDPEPLTETTYYRLEQTDYDGASKIVGEMITIKAGSEHLPTAIIYPNPANEWVHVSVTSDVKRIKVLNASAEVLIIKDASTPNQELTLNIQGYQPGIYFVLIESEEHMIKKCLAVR